MAEAETPPIDPEIPEAEALGLAKAARRLSLQPYIWMLFSSFAFSVMGLCTQLAGTGCSWQITAIARCTVPLIFLGIWTTVVGVPLIFAWPRALWGRSLAGSCSLVANFYALKHLPLTDVYTIGNLYPIWVAMLSWPILGKIPRLGVWLCLVSGVLGVVQVAQPSFTAQDGAIVVMIVASVFTALALLGLHHLSALDTRVVVAHFSGTALLFSLGSAYLMDAAPSDEPFQIQHLAYLLGTGIGATLGQYFLTKAFTSGDPARLGIIGMTQILFAMLFDRIILDRQLDPSKLLGIPLILIPAIWLMWRSMQMPTKSNS